MKNYKLKINGNSYHINVKSAEGNQIQLEVNGSFYNVEMETEVKTSKTPTLIRTEPKPVQGVEPLKTQKSTKTITAPLPGVILKVMASEGAHVKTGDELIILEAMKMENTILAESSGTILKIHKKAGESVLQGDVLMEIG